MRTILLFSFKWSVYAAPPPSSRLCLCLFVCLSVFASFTVSAGKEDVAGGARGRHRARPEVEDRAAPRVRLFLPLSAPCLPLSAPCLPLSAPCLPLSAPGCRFPLPVAVPRPPPPFPRGGLCTLVPVPVCSLPRRRGCSSALGGSFRNLSCAAARHRWPSVASYLFPACPCALGTRFARSSFRVGRLFLVVVGCGVTLTSPATSRFPQFTDIIVFIYLSACLLFVS